MASRNAKRWNIAAIITGVVLSILGGISVLTQIIVQVHVR